MTPEMGLVWEVTFWEFLFVTVILGGGGAWMVGRSTALTWSGWGLLAFYIVLLALAVRFIHFALFNGSFLLPASTFGVGLYYGIVDYVVLFAIAACGRVFVRNQQMARQYGFLQRQSA
ncbi:DUF6867 family protein [Jiella avicenniae]|uniref:DUF6867 domain-containing protein n=1 Tax=Jiella avicenniae TaxID=2907202 RepID=A0A9X1P289_9HYPH|nr:hypothetical protein [Jiella avicenniae]MCE7029183.1 hypothetical protein [Jiella avicenniae]